MVMTSYESPAAARRRLRLAVRKAREAIGLTQGQVAEQLSWSISKVNRMENGEVTISPTDLAALLNLFGVTNKDVVNEMSRDAKAAKQRGWWHESRYREHVTPATLQLIQFENEAVAIRCFQPTLVPGMLQIPAYAEAVLGFWTELSSADRAARLEIRSRRRGLMFERPDPPQYYLALDESVVLRRVGGAAVMAEQLQVLLDAASHPTITLRILPLADGAGRSQLGSTTICHLDGEENAILYRELTTFDSITEGGEEPTRYRRMFETLWMNCFTPEQSERLIRAQVAMLLSSLDRQS